MNGKIGAQRHHGLMMMVMGVVMVVKILLVSGVHDDARVAWRAWSSGTRR